MPRTTFVYQTLCRCIILAPAEVAVFLAGGNLTALKKPAPGDIRPIAVGESIRRLTGKCLCVALKEKAASFFEPSQFGVACPNGAEKVIHGLRACIDKHWFDDDFGVLKIDMKNAFNLVSRQALLSECAKHFPELFPWVSWCYGQHPLLWHSLGCLTSESGVQQGDPLGPLLFSLVLNILVKAISTTCSNLLNHAWYMDDGVLAGPRATLCRAITLLQSEGPALGIHINMSKCEVFSSHSLDLFPPGMITSDKPNLVILGAPIGNKEFCSSLVSKGLKNVAGLWSQLEEAIDMFNGLVASSDVISVENLLSSSSVHQKALSEKLDDHQFNLLLNCSSVADRARLLSVSSPFAASWLSVIPSEGLGLHLTAPIFQVALKWWLGLDTSGGSQCSLCPGSVLDHLSHHAVTCKSGGDVVTRHNRLRDCIVEVCRRAHIGVQVEVGNNLTPSHSKTRPADILIPNWVMGRAAALDVSVTSPLNPQTLLEAGVTATAAALTTEERKHDENDPKCSELGWVCIPVVAESYGAWGREATLLFLTIASRIATLSNKPKSVTLIDIYGRLNLQLVRANATSILARLMPPSY
eukprot:Em0014g493a